MKYELTLTRNSHLPGRQLNWPSCYNTRDLGGLATTDGRETRWQVVIRSDNLRRLTEEGKQALLDYGVGTIVDLRGPEEVMAYPSPFAGKAAESDGPSYHNLPLEKYYPHVSALIRKAATRAEVYCIVLDHYPDALADIMRAILCAQPGGIVIHSHAGKDCTGIVSAMLLSLAGVSAEAIAADYAKSEEHLRPYAEENPAEGDEVDFWLRSTATAEMMCKLLDHVDAKYGGPTQYLRAAGLSSQEIDKLRGRLRSP